ncbi:MAG TPA: ribulose-phosphate 3-epimerase [Anaerolineae bacterium]|nr:ribulose-phosphate 3-epimerase [Anaerolineae bacterium]HQK15120.1 ribulose-phosphate 3-epimerase [Anaerolineae bacterium]
MSKYVRIAASILSADFAYLGTAIEMAEAAGADVIHVDVMDGHFVPNLTIGPPVVAALRKVTRLPLDVHLMIENPERYVEAFAEAGADMLTVHPEATPHLHRVVQQIHELGVQAGVALNPATPESSLSYVASMLDLVLVMTVNPGFGGQEFLPETLPKIAAVRRILDAAGRGAWLSVDGGINVATIPLVVAQGADHLVAGSAIFSAPEGVAAAVRALRGAVQALTTQQPR